MEVATFKTILNANGGPNKLYAITFDGNGRKVFSKDEPFDMSMLDEPNKCFKFKQKDWDGNEVIIYKPVETVFAVIFCEDINKADEIIMRQIMN